MMMSSKLRRRAAILVVLLVSTTTFAQEKAAAAAFVEGSPGLLVQSWFSGSTDNRFSLGLTDPKFAPTGQLGAGVTTFRLRRVELSYEGKVAERVKFRAMVDPANIHNGALVVKDILQDAWVGYSLPYHELKAGQFKVPLMMEGVSSSGKLDFAERSFIGRAFGDQRDLGVMLESSKVPFVEYQLAVVNGQGKNLYDNGPWKDIVARVVLKPARGLSLGGSSYLGKTYDTTLQAYRQKNRGGIEAAVEYANAMLKFEYMAAGEDHIAGSTSYRVAPAGAYVTAGYRFGAFQLVARYDYFDSDTHTSASDCAPASESTPAGAYLGSDRCTKLTTVAVGLNYDFAPAVLHGAKLQLDYYHDFDEVRRVGASEAFLVGQVKF